MNCHTISLGQYIEILEEEEKRAEELFDCIIAESLKKIMK